MPPAEILCFQDVDKAELYCEPNLSRAELAEMVKRRENIVIRKLEVHVFTHSEPEVKKIVLLSVPVRTMSFAFRKVFGFAEKIMDCFHVMMGDEFDAETRTYSTVKYGDSC